MALQPEIWQTQIVESLYKNNEFLTHATNGDEYVVGGTAVHIPQAGADSGVVVNRASLPATVGQRTDSEIIYSLDEYTSNPILIKNIDTIQLSYNKRESVMKGDQRNLKQKQAEGMLYKWGSTASGIIRTSGAGAATTQVGASGNRKLFTKYDLLMAKLRMDKDDIPADDRVALLPPDFLVQLLQDKDLAVNFVQYADIANGILGKVYGFLIMSRSSVMVYDNASTPVAKTVDAASAATDNIGALCWHPDSVERALGTVKMFERLNDPTFYGDIYSFLVMLGGRVRRADGKGIVAIVEAASA